MCLGSWKVALSTSELTLALELPKSHLPPHPLSALCWDHSHLSSWLFYLQGFPDSSVGKERIYLQCMRPWFNSWVGKIRWRSNRLPTPIFSGFPCGSAGKEFTCNSGNLGSILELGRSPGEGKGYLLQYSGLENSMDCIVHWVAQSRRDWAAFTLTDSVTGVLAKGYVVWSESQEVWFGKRWKGSSWRQRMRRALSWNYQAGK